MLRLHALSSERAHRQSPQPQHQSRRDFNQYKSKNIALRAKKPISRKAAIKREEIGACSDYPEREQARPKVNFFSGAQRNGVFAFIDFKAWNAAYGLVMTDGSLLTIRKHQQQTQILEKIEINERVFQVFV